MKNLGIRLSPAVLAVPVLTLLLLLLSGGAQPREARAASGESEYDFTWLDPDKKIYVLQNRRYLKAERVMISALAGVASSGAYRRTFSLEPRLAFYFQEWLGIEGFYSLFLNQENSTFEALKTASPNALPTVREFKSQMGALVHYVPWYAKINVFNQILYFDWYFSGGLGSISADLDVRTKSTDAPSYRAEDLFTIYLGTGHQYHLSRELTVRLDFQASFYRAQIFGTSGESVWYSNYVFGAGVGVRL